MVDAAGNMLWLYNQTLYILERWTVKNEHPTLRTVNLDPVFENATDRSSFLLNDLPTFLLVVEGSKRIFQYADSELIEWLDIGDKIAYLVLGGTGFSWRVGEDQVENTVYLSGDPDAAHCIAYTFDGREVDENEVIRGCTDVVCDCKKHWVLIPRNMLNTMEEIEIRFLDIYYGVEALDDKDNYNKEEEHESSDSKEQEKGNSTGINPLVVRDDYDIVKSVMIQFPGNFKSDKLDKEIFERVARPSIRTKLYENLAQLSDTVVDAVLCIPKPGESIDLYNIYVVQMVKESDLHPCLIKGLVLDLGFRHPFMKRRAKDCYILTCKVSLKHELSQDKAGVIYSHSEQREGMVLAENQAVNERVINIIQLKLKVCPDTRKNFLLINEEEISPSSTYMLANAGIIVLATANIRNIESINFACGGYKVDSVLDLTPDCLGWAGLVFEQKVGDKKFTYVEYVKNSNCCTILVKGPDDNKVPHIKDAVRDGLTAVRKFLEDESVVLVSKGKELKNTEQSSI